MSTYQNQPRERLLVVCFGRGTYNASELGILTRHAGDAEWLKRFDAQRHEAGLPTLTELDTAPSWQLKLHGRGEHAAPLIYACALADLLAIDQERFEIVAVTGNSMGWYIALAAAGALNHLDAFNLIGTTATLMQQQMRGGQILYPWVDDNWRPQFERRRELLALVESLHAREGNELYLSIDLGGMLVLGGNEAGLAALMEQLPADDRYPLRLPQHAAFHTPMQHPIRTQAREAFGPAAFTAPQVPLVDGTGRMWTPWSTDPQALWNYTLGEQLVAPYDFTAAVRVGVKEFAPDRVVVLGPGTTLGGATAQVLIQQGWKELTDKAVFQARQAQTPVLLSMGMPGQRATLV